MKEHDQKKRKITKTGQIGESREFNIKATGKAFKILSDKMYSDKVRAVIRELAANAKDAHIDAGKNDVPFEIHLPNRLEPWFSVKDFGIGLSHDDVMHLYSTYFESTKTDSNNVTGCLGLGSKSPFAYVDAFTVEARWNGIKTLYSCFYDENGIPTITVIGEQANTDEDNGLEIKMPVREEDMREFATKAAKELRRFDPAPTITGSTDYKVEPIEYWVEGTNWKLIKDTSHYGYGTDVHAVQGNVTYPINENSLKDLSESQRIVMDLKMDLFFPIGQLDVSPSREDLSYDKQTIENIKTQLDVVTKELPPLFQDKFKVCKTLWEARILFREITRELPTSLKRLLGDQSVGVKWKGKPLDETFKIVKADFKANIMMFEKNRYGNRARSATDSYNDSWKFQASNNIMFFYDDVGHGAHSRISYFLDINEKAMKYTYLVKTDNKKMLKQFSKALGNVVLQPVSKLPKRPKSDRATRRPTSKVLEYSGRQYDRKDSWKPTELDLNAGGIYVMISRFKVYDKNEHGWREISDDFDTIVALAKDNKIVDLTDKIVYGIRKGDVEKLKDDSGWVSLFDLLRDGVKKVIAKEKVAKTLANAEIYRNFTYDISYMNAELLAFNFAKTSVFGKFLKAHKFMGDQVTDRTKAIESVASKVGYSIKEATATHDLDALWVEVNTKYPMLRLLDDSIVKGYGWNNKRKDVEKNKATVMDYIATVDLIEEEYAKVKPKAKAKAA